ncbi:MAG: hypothetical protein JWP02_6 [Acidimicrobiales bacterium]|nr:hypothetical protein [Acidimicrobiales bacterium]
MSTRIKLLATALLMTSFGAYAAVATFANFNAETNNPGNTVSSGTLVLSDTKSGGTTCYSTGGGSTNTNVNAACDNLFGVTAKKPGDSGSANLTIKNEGSFAASAFKVFSPSCADSDASGETYHGTGSMCAAVQVTIQQYSDALFSTPSACLYGHATGASFDFTDTTKSMAAFATFYPSAGSGLSIGSGLGTGVSAWFKVSFQIPSTVGNNVQGRTASADLTWHVDQ